PLLLAESPVVLLGDGPLATRREGAGPPVVRPGRRVDGQARPERWKFAQLPCRGVEVDGPPGGADRRPDRCPGDAGAGGRAGGGGGGGWWGGGGEGGGGGRGGGAPPVVRPGRRVDGQARPERWKFAQLPCRGVEVDGPPGGADRRPDRCPGDAGAEGRAGVGV